MGTKIVSPTTPERGLGDAVETVAKPIARVLGIDEDCGGCARRKAKLNEVSRVAKAGVRRMFGKR